VVTKTKPHHTNVVVALDVSGSMAGGKLAAALQCLRDLDAACLKAGDTLSVVTFNQAVTVALPVSKKAKAAGAGARGGVRAGAGAGAGSGAHAGKPHARLPTYDAVTLSEVLGGVRAGGGTALHDAILHALGSMQADHDAYHAAAAAKYGADAVRPRCLQLVVVTDGEDGHSAGSAAAVAERLRAPGLWAARSHFRATLVGVGAEAAAALSVCAAGAKHVRVVAGADGGEGIKAAFKRVVEHLQEAVVRVVETKSTVTRVPLPRGGAGAVGGGGRCGRPRLGDKRA
jgi:hypothetical protein